jgi:hypothetical protein
MLKSFWKLDKLTHIQKLGKKKWRKKQNLKIKKKKQRKKKNKIN